MSKEQIEDYLKSREETIKLELKDPFNYGASHKTYKDGQFQHWEDLEEVMDDPAENLVWVFGGNRASKTEFFARYICNFMDKNPGSIVWFCGMSTESSINVQQKAIHKYLPKHWIKPKSSKEVSGISFSAKNGFTGNSLVAPNGSALFFKNYTQDISAAIEGTEMDLAVCDELVPEAWISSLRFRLVTRQGTLAVTYTPIQGMTPSSKIAMSGHVVTEMRPCEKELIQDGEMPYRGRSATGAPIFWWHSSMNPWSEWGHFKKTALAGKSVSDIEIRAFGYIRHSNLGIFPKFSEKNIVNPDQIPTKGTNYMAVDPTGGDRSWFMVWVRVDDLGRHWVYREWPSADRHGDWAEPSTKLDGKPGPAQSSGAGMGISAYKQLIRDLENSEPEPVERFIDPRSGRSSVTSRDSGNHSMIDLLAEDEIGKDGQLTNQGLVFIPPPALEIEVGVQSINELLDYNPESPITAYNEPKLYISENCKNLIYSMKSWTGEDGQKGACKDPIDALRYLVMMNPTYINPNSTWSRGGGTYGGTNGGACDDYLLDAEHYGANYGGGGTY